MNIYFEQKHESGEDRWNDFLILIELIRLCRHNFEVITRG